MYLNFYFFIDFEEENVFEIGIICNCLNCE